MRPSTVVVGALCGFPLLEAATIWPRFSLAIANDHYLGKRIEPIIPKPPPKVIEPPPKLGTGSGASCKRSWLWTRCTPPPSGPHLGEGSSGNGNSDPGSSVGGNPSSNPGSSGQGSSGAPHLGDSSPGRPSSNPGSSPGASGSGMSTNFFYTERLAGPLPPNKRFAPVGCLKSCKVVRWRAFLENIVGSCLVVLAWSQRLCHGS